VAGRRRLIGRRKACLTSRRLGLSGQIHKILVLFKFLEERGSRVVDQWDGARQDCQRVKKICVLHAGAFGSPVAHMKMLAKHIFIERERGKERGKERYIKRKTEA
jgi:hypothetical protein